ncbi:hypothetical protein, partial [Nocardia cyriacigeorgica]|uniref:hypothetical protein n=1 Tax=Nocardia cyriacigeorgica TaxID=135487 RepID=UPI0035C7268D
ARVDEHVGAVGQCCLDRGHDMPVAQSGTMRFGYRHRRQGAAVVHQLRVPRDGRFVVALGMGGMGYAFGAGIGSAFARA